MPTPTLDTAIDGGLVIEADTAAEALQLVRERLGDDARVVDARKVHRGGWKGFFALERVQLTAQAGVADPARTFRDLLAEHATDPDPDPEPSPGPSPGPSLAAEPQPSPDPEPGAVRATPGVAGAAWDALDDLHLPRPIVDACAGLDPRDERVWLSTIADVVGPWCRPLPAGDAVVVGPRADRLADGLGLPVCRPGGVVPPHGSVALKASDSGDGRRWVSEVAAGRWLHAVAGGSRWHAFLFDDALAVSWATPDDLPTALSAASRLGLVLGHGRAPATGPVPVRTTPWDVALTLRALLPRA